MPATAEDSVDLLPDDIVGYARANGKTPEQTAQALRSWGDDVKATARARVTDPRKLFRGYDNVDREVGQHLYQLSFAQEVNTRLPDEESRAAFLRSYVEAGEDPEKIPDEPMRALAHEIRSSSLRNPAFQMPRMSGAPVQIFSGNVPVGDFQMQPGTGGKLNVLLGVDDRDDRTFHTFELDPVTTEEIEKARKEAAEKVERLTKAEEYSRKSLASQMEAQKTGMGGIEGGAGILGASILQANTKAEKIDAMDRLASLNGAGAATVLFKDKVEQTIKADPKLRQMVGKGGLGEDFIRGLAQTYVGTQIAIAETRGDAEQVDEWRQVAGALEEIYPGSTGARFRGGLEGFISRTSETVGAMAPTLAIGNVGGGLVGRSALMPAIRAASLAPMSTGAYGNSYAQMLNEADAIEQQYPERAAMLRANARSYAALSSIVETGSEMMFRGEVPFLRGPGKTVAGLGAKAKAVGKAIGRGAVEEGLIEEGTAGLVTEYGLNPALQETPGRFGNITEAVAQGGLIGGVLGGGHETVTQARRVVPPGENQTPPPGTPPPGSAVPPPGPGQTTTPPPGATPPPGQQQQTGTPPPPPASQGVPVTYTPLDPNGDPMVDDEGKTVVEEGTYYPESGAIEPTDAVPDAEGFVQLVPFREVVNARNEDGTPVEPPPAEDPEIDPYVDKAGEMVAAAENSEEAGLPAVADALRAKAGAVVDAGAEAVASEPRVSHPLTGQPVTRAALEAEIASAEASLKGQPADVQQAIEQRIQPLRDAVAEFDAPTVESPEETPPPPGEPGLGAGAATTPTGAIESPTAPEAETPGEVPLGWNRAAVRDRSLEALSDDEFYAERKRRTKALDQAEEQLDEKGEDALTVQQLTEIGEAQDAYAAAELEKFRRDSIDLHQEELLRGLEEEASGMTSWIRSIKAGESGARERLMSTEMMRRFEILVEEVNRQGGINQVEALGERGKMSHDQAEVFGWKLQAIRDLLDIAGLSMNGTPQAAVGTPAAEALPEAKPKEADGRRKVVTKTIGEDTIQRSEKTFNAKGESLTIQWPFDTEHWASGVNWASKNIGTWLAKRNQKGDELDAARSITSKAREKIKDLTSSSGAAARPSRELQFWIGVYDFASQKVSKITDKLANQPIPSRDAEPTVPPQPITEESLQSTFGYSPEEAKTLMVVVDAARRSGVDMSRAFVERPPLEPGQEERAQIAIDRETGAALIRALRNPDITSFPHELAHFIRHHVLNRATLTAASPLTLAEIETVEKWAGATDGVWSVPAEEKFGEAFEKWIETGKFSSRMSPEVRRAFEKLAQWFRDFVAKFGGRNVEFSPEVAALVERVFGVETKPPTKSKQQSLADRVSRVRTPENRIGKGQHHEVYRDGDVVLRISVSHPKSTAEQRKSANLSNKHLGTSLRYLGEVDGSAVFEDSYHQEIDPFENSGSRVPESLRAGSKERLKSRLIKDFFEQRGFVTDPDEWDATWTKERVSVQDALPENFILLSDESVVPVDVFVEETAPKKKAPAKRAPRRATFANLDRPETPLLNFLRERKITAKNNRSVMGRLAKVRTAKQKGRPVDPADQDFFAAYDGQPLLGDFPRSVQKYLSGIFTKDGGQAPDLVRDEANREFPGQYPTVNDLYKGIAREAESIARLESAQRDEEARMDQDERFARDVKSPHEDGQHVQKQGVELRPGDFLEVEGEVIEVVSVDRNGRVVLRDGKTYGTQVIESDEDIFVDLHERDGEEVPEFDEANATGADEFAPRESTEAEGQLIPEAEMPFNLVGEETTETTFTPPDRRTQEEIERDAGQEMMFQGPVTPAQDAAYLAAVERGDLETVQQMVDEAARAAGYNSGSAYHFTTRVFDVFDNQVAQDQALHEAILHDDAVAEARSRGERPPEGAVSSRPGWTTGFGKYFVFPADSHFFFLGDYPTQQRKNIKGRRLVKVHLRLGKTLDLTRQIPGSEISEIIDYAKQLGIKIDGAILGGLRNARLNGVSPEQLFQWVDRYLPFARATAWREMMDFLGYESIKFESNSSGTALLEPHKGPGDGKKYITVAVLKPNQIKSADPVTYDQQGNPIPLSQRFNPASPSILNQSEAGIDAEVDRIAEAANQRFRYTEPSPRGDTTKGDAFYSEDDFRDGFIDAFQRGDYRAAYDAVAETNSKLWRRVLKQWVKAAMADPTSDAARYKEWMELIAVQGIKPNDPGAPPPPAGGVVPPSPKVASPPTPPPPPKFTPPPAPASGSHQVFSAPALKFLADLMRVDIKIRPLRKYRGAYRPSDPRGTQQRDPLVILHEHLLKGNVDEAVRTLAHEIGHAIDYMIASVRHPQLAQRLAPIQQTMREFGDMWNTSKNRLFPGAADVLKAEAIEVSKEMRPGYSPQSKYRNSGDELYADFLSAILTRPDVAYTKAPFMTHAFFAAINQKPEVAESYRFLNDLLKGGQDDLFDAIRAHTAEQRRAALERLQKEQQTRHAMGKGFRGALNSLIGNFWSKHTTAGARRHGGGVKGYLKRWWHDATHPDEGFVQQAEEAELYHRARTDTLTQRMLRYVFRPLEAAGVAEEQLEEYLRYFQIIHEDTQSLQYLNANPDEFREFLLWINDTAGLGMESEINGAAAADLERLGARIVGELTQMDDPTGSGNMYEYVVDASKSSTAPPIAQDGMFAFNIARYQWNAGAFTEKAARDGMDHLKRQLGPARFAELQNRAKEFHRLMAGVAHEAHAAGLFRERIWLEKIEPNLGNYVPRMVLDYLTAHVDPGVKERKGSVKSVLPAHVAALAKAEATYRRIARQKWTLALLADANAGGWAKDELTVVGNTPKGREAIKRAKEHGKAVRSFYQNGVLKWMIVNDPQLVKFVESIDPDWMGMVGDLARQNSEFWRKNTTIWKAGFVFWNNGIRQIRSTFGPYGWKGLVAVGKGAKIAKNWADASFGKADLMEETADLIEKGVLPPTGKLLAADLTSEQLLDEVLRGAASFSDLSKRHVGPSVTSRIPGVKTLARLVNTLTYFSAIVEAMPKAGTYDFLIDKGLQDSEARKLARLEGIPNSGVAAGRMGSYAGLASLFYRVAVQGHRRNAELAANPKTRNKFWFWMGMETLGAKMLYHLIANGIMDSLMPKDDEGKEQVDWREAYSRIGRWKIMFNDAILIGWSTPDQGYEPPWGHSRIPGDWNPMFIRLPHSDQARTTAPAAAFGLWNFLPGGKPLESPNKLREARDIFSTVAVDINPGIRSAFNFAAIADPAPPVDSYSGSEIVPASEWKIMGVRERALALTQDMLSQTALQDIPGAAKLGLSRRTTDVDSTLPGWGKVLMSIPGAKSVIAVDNILNEDFRESIEARDRRTVEVKRNLGEATKRAVSDLSQLEKIPAADRTQEVRARINTLRAFYNRHYPSSQRDKETFLGHDKAGRQQIADEIEEAAKEALKKSREQAR